MKLQTKNHTDAATNKNVLNSLKKLPVQHVEVPHSIENKTKGLPIKKRDFPYPKNSWKQ